MKIVRQVGKSQRIHVHLAYRFHAPMAIGCALRMTSAASISGTGIAFCSGGKFAAVAFGFVRNGVGMVRFAPQYAHVMRMLPASGSFGAPHAGQGKVCVMISPIGGNYKSKLG